MAFEEYKKQPVKRSAQAFVSVNKSGMISISRSAYDRWFSEYSGVVFLFDPETKAFALRPTNSEERHVRAIRSNSGNYQISGGSFFRDVGYPLPERAVRFSLEWDDQIEAFICREIGT